MTKEDHGARVFAEHWGYETDTGHVLTVHESAVRSNTKTAGQGETLRVIFPSRARERGGAPTPHLRPSDSYFDLSFQDVARRNGVRQGTIEYSRLFRAWSAESKRRYATIKRKEGYTKAKLELHGVEYNASTYERSTIEN